MNKKKLKLLFVSVNRSDYGIWRPVLKILKANLINIEVGIFATAGHLSSRSGETITEIYEDNFHTEIFECPSTLDNDTPMGGAGTISLISSSLGMFINKFKPSVICILGDRYEALASAITSSLFRIPIVHFHGGSITEGALDDNFRHAISKLSHYHFVECENFKNRVIQLGEKSNNIMISGAPSLNELKNFTPLTFKSFKKKFKLLSLKSFILITLHSETTKTKEYNKLLATNFFKTCIKSGYDLLITSPNPDPSSEPIFNVIESYLKKNQKNFYFIPHLGQIGYFNAINLCDFMVGNSSSGIIEAASFKKCVINVGERQKNRACGKNVIHCSEKINEIEDAFLKARSLLKEKNFFENLRNLYFQENSESIILSFFKQNIKFYQKSFVNLNINQD